MKFTKKIKNSLCWFLLFASSIAYSEYPVQVEADPCMSVPGDSNFQTQSKLMNTSAEAFKRVTHATPLPSEVSKPVGDDNTKTCVKKNSKQGALPVNPLNENLENLEQIHKALEEARQLRNFLND